MSGAEALFVIGLITSSWNLLCMTQTVVQRVIQFKSDINEVPKEFRNLEAVLPLLQITLKRTEERSKSTLLEAETVKALNAIFRNCDSKIAELTEIFKKYGLDSKSLSGWKALCLAIGSVAKDAKVHSLIEELTQNIVTISAHTTSLTPTAEEISDVVTPELGSRIDRSISRAINVLKDRRKSSGHASGQIPHEQGAGQHINAKTVEIHHHNNIYTLPNGHLSAAGPHGLLPQVSSASLRPESFDAGSRTTSGEHVTGAGHHEHSRSRHRVDSAASSHHRESIASLHSPLLSPNHRGRSGSRSSIRSSTSYQSSASSVQTPIFSPGYNSATPQTPLSPYNDNFQPRWSTATLSAKLNPTASAFKEANQYLSAADALVPNPSTASSDTKSACSEAHTLYYQAIEKFVTINTGDPLLQLRRYRGLTYAQLGLTKVTKRGDRDGHLEKARHYNLEARAVARQAISNNAGGGRIGLCKVQLDKAGVQARAARIAEKKLAAATSNAPAHNKGGRRTSSSTIATTSSTATTITDMSTSSVTKMRLEAFNMYRGLCHELEGRCQTLEEYDVHAQALLGCGEVAEALLVSGNAGDPVLLMQKHGVAEAGDYYCRARECVTMGMDVCPSLEEEDEEERAEQLENLKKTMALIQLACSF